MAFDYLNDLFGRFRKGKKTKYTDIERRTVSILQNFYSGQINADDFGESMRAIDEEFDRLMFDTETNSYIFDEDTPGWLNLFLGNKFRPWYRFHKSFNAAKNNPELTSDPRWHEVECRADIENRSLMEAVNTVLSNIAKDGRP